MKTLDDAPDAGPADIKNAIVVFIHIEPQDLQEGSSAETKLIKNAKWLSRKWDTLKIVLHSFTHLGEEKAEAGEAQKLLDRAQQRLQQSGYTIFQTPYGYFLNLTIDAPGHPLARIFKAF
jgi:hypothetical protein